MMRLCWARGRVGKDWHGNQSAVAGESDEKDATGGQPQHHCGLWLRSAGCLFASSNYCSFSKTWATITSRHQQRQCRSSAESRVNVIYWRMPLKHNVEKSILKSIMYNTVSDRGLRRTKYELQVATGSKRVE